MIAKIFSLITGTMMFISYNGYAQYSIWTETFDHVTANWTLNIPVGTNEADSNYWVIGNAEAGLDSLYLSQNPYSCSVAGDSGCSSCTAGDTTRCNNRTLHIVKAPSPCSGAKYDKGGGATYPATHLRTQHNILTDITEYEEMSLSIDFTGGGGLGNDFSIIEYSIDTGKSWTILDTLKNVLINDPGGACPLGKGKWTRKYISLPMETIKMSGGQTIQFAFTWYNDDDGVGDFLSVAIDNISLNIFPIAGFIASDTVICEDECINFTDQSSGVIADWKWILPGSFLNTYFGKNISNICYADSGTYDVTLIISSPDGSSDTLIKENYITVLSCPDTIPNDTTGISILSKQANIAVYPNPSEDGIFYLKSNKEKLYAKIFNVIGKLEYFVIVDEKGTHIDLSGYSKGLYILEAENINNKGFYRQKLLYR